MERQKIMEELGRLARYKCNDAVRLAFLAEEEAGKISRLDLTGLAELKRSGNGAIEIKLVDRLRVLELMDKIDQRESGEDLGTFLSGLGKGEEE